MLNSSKIILFYVIFVFQFGSRVFAADNSAIILSENNFVSGFDGGGQILFQNEVLIMRPKVSLTKDETHASLVFLKPTVQKPVQNFDITLTYKVTHQLRQNSANDWEVFWLMFGHNNSIHEKKTNYFITKPRSGGELGFAFDEIGQIFIHTDNQAVTQIGQQHKFRYLKKSSRLTVYRDDQLFYDHDETRDEMKTLLDQKGAIGFYLEDAEVEISNLKFLNLDS